MTSRMDRWSENPFEADLLDEIVEHRDRSFVPLIIEKLNELIEIPHHHYPIDRNIIVLVSTLGKLKDDRAIETLMYLVNIGTYDSFALEALCEIGSDQAIEQLINKLGRGFSYWDEWRSGHNALIEAIASFGERSIPGLLEICKSPTENEYRRASAAEALCHIGGAKVADELLQLLIDPNSVPAIFEMVGELKRLKDPRFIAPLIHHMEADTRVGSQHVGQVFAEVATSKQLIEFLHNEHFQVRQASIEALKLRPSPDAVTALIPLLSEDRHSYHVARALVKIEDIRAMNPLLDLVDTTSWVADMAVEVGGQQAFAPLMEKLINGDEEVRIRASSGLAKLGDTRAIPAIRQALQKAESLDNRRVLLGHLATLDDEQSIPDLLECFYESPKEKKSHVIRALGWFKSDKAIEPLQEILFSLPRVHSYHTGDIIKYLKRHKTATTNPLLKCLQHHDIQTRLRVIPILFEYCV